MIPPSRTSDLFGGSSKPAPKKTAVKKPAAAKKPALDIFADSDGKLYPSKVLRKLTSMAL